MRRSLAVAGALAVALATGACSGGIDADAKSLAAAIRQQAIKQGSVATTFALDVAGQHLTGKGAAKLGRGPRASSVTIDSAGQKTDVRFVGDAVYVKAPAYLSRMLKKGKTWVDLSSDKQAATMLTSMGRLAEQGDLMQLLKQITRAGTVKSSAETEFDGRSATRHVITMKLAKLDEYPMGLDKGYKERFASAGVRSYRMKLWVGENGLPIKLTMDLSEMYGALNSGMAGPPGDDMMPPDASPPKVKAELTVTYSKWGKAVTVTAPPKDEIGKIKTPAPSQPRKPSAKPN